MTTSPTLQPLAHALRPTRLRATLLAAGIVFAMVWLLTWRSTAAALALRVFIPALAALLVFALVERWPRRMPPPLARWAAQVTATAAAVPLSLWGIYWANTPPHATPWWQDTERAGSFLALSFLGMLVSSWMAMAAIMRQRDAQILQVERMRGELERQALDARMRLLQAQVEPHFLFNTLATVQALVDAGSPKASPVLASLVAYLRAAVPRLSQPTHLAGQEIEMVRAYLHLMQLRMPDRLQFSVQADPLLETLPLPPTTLMTLVENAVRHGIDPSLEGGRIDVRLLALDNGRCLAEVRDSGVGIQPSSAGLGTGLSALRERLRLAFGGRAELRLSEVQPHGLLAQIEFPRQGLQGG